MTQKEAEALIVRVQQEAPGVQVTLLHARRNANGFRVQLLLRSIQRVQTAYKPRDWVSIKETWYWFLHGKEAEEEKETRYLVGGMQMLIIKCKDGYWRGSASQGGIDIKMYFGKVDPRGNWLKLANFDRCQI